MKQKQLHNEHMKKYLKTEKGKLAMKKQYQKDPERINKAVEKILGDTFVLNAILIKLQDQNKITIL